MEWMVTFGIIESKTNILVLGKKELIVGVIHVKAGGMNPIGWIKALVGTLPNAIVKKQKDEPLFQYNTIGAKKWTDYTVHSFVGINLLMTIIATNWMHSMTLSMNTILSICLTQFVDNIDKKQKQYIIKYRTEWGSVHFDWKAIRHDIPSHLTYEFKREMTPLMSQTYGYKS